MENEKTIEIELPVESVKECFNQNTPVYLATIPIRKIAQMADIDDLIEQRLRSLGVKTISCQNCGQEILFLATKNGKSMPTTLALKSHFADCPGAAQFRREK